MKKHLCILLAGAISVSGCSWISALNPWSSEEETKPVEAAEVLPVNRYLWQASLDKLSSLPLLSTDAKGGVIVSDWYGSARAPEERFKVTARVLCQELRADGLSVQVFKMVRVNGNWEKARPDPKVAAEIETAILKQARVLYRKAVAAGEE